VENKKNKMVKNPTMMMRNHPIVMKEHTTKVVNHIIKMVKNPTMMMMTTHMNEDHLITMMMIIIIKVQTTIKKSRNQMKLVI